MIGAHVTDPPDCFYSSILIIHNTKCYVNLRSFRLQLCYTSPSFHCFSSFPLHFFPAMFPTHFSECVGSRWFAFPNKILSLILLLLTHSLIDRFVTFPNSMKLQTIAEMWLSKDFKIQIA